MLKEEWLFMQVVERVVGYLVTAEKFCANREEFEINKCLVADYSNSFWFTRYAVLTDEQVWYNMLK